jgi:hypothetical protein
MHMHITVRMLPCSQGRRLLSEDGKQALVPRLTACAAVTAAKLSRVAAAGRNSSGKAGDCRRSCAMRPSSCTAAARTLTENSCK